MNSKLEARKLAFNRIRDLPLHCPEFLTDKNYTCWGKHRLLFLKLKKLSYRVRFRVCLFKWSEFGLPKRIYKLAPQDLDKHLYLEVFINDRWTVLDCSNDSKLSHYNKWNGKSNCRLAVKPIRIFSPSESIKIEKEMRCNFNSIVKKYSEFYKLLNLFLCELRAK
ncbi:MAG: hypothetical protein V1722_04375 [Candidatus Micrarchaeota archaeon]